MPWRRSRNSRPKAPTRAATWTSGASSASAPWRSAAFRRPRSDRWPLGFPASSAARPRRDCSRSGKSSNRSAGTDASRSHCGGMNRLDAKARDAKSVDAKMDAKTDAKILASLLAQLLVMAGLIFAAAGTLQYWQAWLFLLVYAGASLLGTIDLMRRDRALLRRRMRGGPFAEKEPTQRLIMSIVSVAFIGLLLVPAFDHRFGW